MLPAGEAALLRAFLTARDAPLWPPGVRRRQCWAGSQSSQHRRKPMAGPSAAGVCGLPSAPPRSEPFADHSSARRGLLPNRGRAPQVTPVAREACGRRRPVLWPPGGRQRPTRAEFSAPTAVSTAAGPELRPQLTLRPTASAASARPPPRPKRHLRWLSLGPREPLEIEGCKKRLQQKPLGVGWMVASIRKRKS